MEKCFKCEKEMRNATPDNLDGLVFLLDSYQNETGSWVCPICLKMIEKKILFGAE